MPVDIPQQGQNKQNAESAKSQANLVSKSGGQDTVSNTDEYQRRWIQQRDKHQEQQKRLAQQGEIRNARERQSVAKTTTSTPKKKFMKGMGKYIIPATATGGGIIGMLFGLN